MTREAVVGVASKFLDGLKGVGVSAIPFGPDITLTENGKVTARGVADVRTRLTGNAKSVKGMRVTKWIVEGGEAIALCQLDTTDGRVQFVSQYLRIYDGLIREAQANFGRQPTPEDIERYRAAARRNQS